MKLTLLLMILSLSSFSNEKFREGYYSLNRIKKDSSQGKNIRKLSLHISIQDQIAESLRREYSDMSEASIRRQANVLSKDIMKKISGEIGLTSDLKSLGRKVKSGFFRSFKYKKLLGSTAVIIVTGIGGASIYLSFDDSEEKDQSKKGHQGTLEITSQDLKVSNKTSSNDLSSNELFESESKEQKPILNK